MRDSKAVGWGRHAIALVALSACLAYVWWHRDELATVAALSPFHLILCVLSTAASMAASGAINFVMVRQLGGSVGLSESLSLSVLATGGNMLLPVQGGTIVRAAYLKRVHDFNYAGFVATVLVTQILIMLLCSTTAVVALGWMSLMQNRSGLAPMLGIALFCLSISVLTCLLPRVHFKGNWALERIAEFSNALFHLRRQPLFLAKLLALVSVQLAGQVLSFWTACSALGFHFAATEALVMGALGMLASIFSITPSAVGIYEAATASAGAVLAVAPAQSVAGALVSRVVLMVVVIIVMPFAVSFLASKSSARAP